MSPIHQPSRRQALLFFLFTLVVGAGVVVWIFFINKGKLTVKGESPFAIRAGGTVADCIASPCTIELTPRMYGVIVSKNGYQQYTADVAISRMKTQEITAVFNYIPTISDRGPLIVPFADAPLIPQFGGVKTLENFPKNVKAFSLSGSGNFLLLTLGKELYVYDVIKRTLEKSDLTPTVKPTWLKDTLILLFTKGEGIDAQQKLARVLRSGGEAEVIVSFERPFKNPVLKGAPKSEKVLIEETDGGVRSYYFIDADKKSRRRVELGAGASNVHWVGDYLVFDADKKVYVLDSSTLEKTELPTLDSENIASMKDSLIFVGDRKQGEQEESVGASIGDVVNQLTGGETEVSLLSKNRFLISYDPAQKKFQTLAQIPFAENETIHRLTSHEAGTELYFEKNGHLFEVWLEEPMLQ